MRLSKDVYGVWHNNEGMPVGEHDRDKWGIDCLDWLMEDKNEYITYTRSGDSIVIAIREKDSGHEFIEVLDCKIRRDMRFSGNE